MPNFVSNRYRQATCCDGIDGYNRRLSECNESTVTPRPDEKSDATILSRSPSTRSLKQKDDSDVSSLPCINGKQPPLCCLSITSGFPLSVSKQHNSFSRQNNVSRVLYHSVFIQGSRRPSVTEDDVASIRTTVSTKKTQEDGVKLSVHGIDEVGESLTNPRKMWTTL